MVTKSRINEKLFQPKETVCPICEKPFVRYQLKKSQFSISKRDIDYRPLYMGDINPRLFAIIVCPNCLYSGEEKYFCPKVSEAELRQQQLFAGHKAQWEAASRAKAAGSGQQIWKDLASEKLKSLASGDIAILKRITPLLKRAASDVLAKGKPYNELLHEGDPIAAIKSYELAAICYKARKAGNRIMGYAYLNGAWTARDAAEATDSEEEKKIFNDLENAFLRETVSFLTIANLATRVEDSYLPDGTLIPKENLPQSRIFEIMFILAGANRILGNIAESNKFLEQIMFGAGADAQGQVLWFITQAKEIRRAEGKMLAKENEESTEEAPPPEEA